jgi:mitogen-activated protein kinase 1/3
VSDCQTICADASGPLFDFVSFSRRSQTRWEIDPEAYKLNLKPGNAGKLPDGHVLHDVKGAGAYGCVCTASTGRKRKHHSLRKVAIKRVANVMSDTITAKRILREVSILRQLKHPNLVRLVDVIPAKAGGFLNL